MRKGPSVMSNDSASASPRSADVVTGEERPANGLQRLEHAVFTNAHERWWTRRDAAAYVHVSEATIGREVRRGRLRHTRVGGRRALRFRREWLDAWLTDIQPVEESVAADAMLDNTAEIRPRYIRSIRGSMRS